MNKFILTSFVLMGTLFAQTQLNHLPYGIKSTCDKLLFRQAYISCINYKTKNPDWVSYTITKESVKGWNTRKNRFYEDKEILV